MKLIVSMAAYLFATFALCATIVAQDARPKPPILITNAKIFDGKNETLAEAMSVLVEGNKIAKITKSIPPPVGATVIDGGGRTLMPGLTDAHWHAMLAAIRSGSRRPLTRG